MFVVLDLSQSVIRGENTDRLTRSLRTVVAHAVSTESDLEIVIPKGDGTSKTIVDVSFSPGPGVEPSNPGDLREWDNKQMAEVKKALTSMKTRTTDPTTDLLGVLEVGADWLSQHSGTKLLILISDLAHNSPQTSIAPFVLREPHVAGGWSKFIATQQTLPDLRKVNVAVAHLDDGSLPSTNSIGPPQIAQRIGSEWLEFFVTAQAVGPIAVVAELQPQSLDMK